MNSIVSSLVMYPGSLLRSGVKSTTKVCKKLVGKVKTKSGTTDNSVQTGTVVNTKVSMDGRDKPVAIQEC
jgi:hypothetical protein